MERKILSAELEAILNKELLNCIITGCSTNDLRNNLMEQFGFSRSEANTIICTGIAWMQTERAAQRYKDDGLEEYVILGREEEDHCGYDVDCREMNGKKFLLSEMVIGKNAPPFHPNCKCKIVPKVKSELLQRRLEKVAKQEREKRAQQAEAHRLNKEAKDLRSRARALKKEGRTNEAKILEAQARDLEKKYKELYRQISNN